MPRIDGKHLDRGTKAHLLDNIVSSLENHQIGKSVNQLQLCTLSELSEIPALSKWLGHPVIVREKGLRKLYDRTHKDIQIPEENITLIVIQGKCSSWRNTTSNVCLIPQSYNMLVHPEF